MSHSTTSPLPASGPLRTIVICALAAFFYLYEFLARVMPSAQAHELMQYFNISAASLGLLSALFFYGYIPLQIPAGMIFDRFGARRMLALMTLICALASAGFALSHSFLLALGMRFLMGAAGAFAFTGAAFTAARWISARYFAMYTGLIQSLGCVGAILGQAPIAHLTQLYGFRNTNLYAAAIGVVFAILIYAFVRDQPEHNQEPSLKHTTRTTTKKIDKLQPKRLWAICHNRQNWWIGAYGCLSWASINLFASMWGIPYLMEYYHISSALAGSMLAGCWVGVGIGSPLLGWWAEYSHNRRGVMLLCIGLGLASSLSILFDSQLSSLSMIVMLFIFGLSAGGQPISFDLIYINNKKQNIGTAIGFNNMCVIAGGLILQPLCGYLLQLTHTSSMHHILHSYTLQQYQHALLLMPACFLLNILVVCFAINKTLCKKHVA